MILMAEPFATTPAGYVTSIGTPVLAILIGGMWKAWAARLAKQDTAIGKVQESATEQNKALAILLADHNHMTQVVMTDNARIGELDKSLAVLTSQVEEHHRWVERQQHPHPGNKQAL